MVKETAGPRLVLVPGPADGRPSFNAVCCACSKLLTLGRDQIHADLNGEPFRSYYCGPCAAKARRAVGKTEVLVDGAVVKAYPKGGDHAACAARELIQGGAKLVTVRCEACGAHPSDCKCD